RHLLADGAHRRPASARVGGDPVAVLPAQEPPHRLAHRAPEEIPARDVDAAPADGGKGPPLAGRVAGARAAVEQLPDAGDVARIAADDGGPHLLADEGDHRRVVAEIAHRGLGLSEPDQPRVGLDLHQAHVERVVAAEVADVRVLGGNWGAEPGGADGGDLHGGSVRPPREGSQRAAGGTARWVKAVRGSRRARHASGTPAAPGTRTTMLPTMAHSVSQSPRAAA